LLSISDAHSRLAVIGITDLYKHISLAAPEFEILDLMHPLPLFVLKNGVFSSR
jgi:hypothetical protein